MLQMNQVMSSPALWVSAARQAASCLLVNST